VEAQVKYLPFNNFNLNFNYSFLHASENILFAPRHLTNLQVHYIYRKISISGGVQQVNGLKTSLQNEHPRENYSLLNFGLQIKAYDWLHIFAETNNILDVQYQVQKGYPMPGINLIGGLNFTFN
jgi:iron complex outermembrane receptor protein